MKKRMLSPLEGHHLMGMIENNGRNKDGYWIWNEGWSDQVIADKLDISVAIVRHRRSNYYGVLKKMGNSSNDSSDVNEKIKKICFEDAAEGYPGTIYMFSERIGIELKERVIHKLRTEGLAANYFSGKDEISITWA